jgi:hypothetical protein
MTLLRPRLRTVTDLVRLLPTCYHITIVGKIAFGQVVIS